MRRDRIITRILLILSITNVALAAPAVVRQGDLDVADAARKRGNEASQETVSEHMSELSGSADSGSDPYFSAPESPSHPPDVDVESLDGWLPGSQAGSEHADSDTESLSGWLAQDPAPESPSGSPHENLAPPESNSIFTDYLKQKLQGKLKKLAIWGATVLISGGVTYGILKNTGVPYVSALFPSPANV